MKLKAYKQVLIRILIKSVDINYTIYIIIINIFSIVFLCIITINQIIRKNMLTNNYKIFIMKLINQVI